MNYAIVENGVVTNIIWLNKNNASKFPNAVFIADIPVGIGDTYEDGLFYRDGERVYSPLEEMERAMSIMLYGVEINE